MTPESALGLPQTCLRRPDCHLQEVNRRSRPCLSHCCSDDHCWSRMQQNGVLPSMRSVHADTPCSPFARQASRIQPETMSAWRGYSSDSAPQLPGSLSQRASQQVCFLSGMVIPPLFSVTLPRRHGRSRMLLDHRPVVRAAFRVTSSSQNRLLSLCVSRENIPE
jgi:hypothetical protein